MTTPANASTASGSRASTEWRAWVAALAFLTRLPAHHLATVGVEDLPASATYFPVVGLVVAAIGGLVYLAAAALWPAPLAIILAVATTVWLTGAFHEDAVADSFDGFGGGWSREQVLTIMKDSRVGSYALVGVTLLLLAKIVALVVIAIGANDPSTSGAGAVLRALIAGHVLGRWSSIPLIWKYEYVRATESGARPSAGKPFVSGITTPRALTATALAVGIVVATCGWKASVLLIVATLVTAIGGRYAQARIGGITGDVLGAVNQFVELSAYLALAAGPAHF